MTIAIHRKKIPNQNIKQFISPNPAATERPENPSGCDPFAYVRHKDLPSLLALWPNEINDFSAKGTKAIIAKLTTALRSERKRGKTGHWSYNLNRHAGLLHALQAENHCLSNSRSHPK